MNKTVKTTDHTSGQTAPESSLTSLEQLMADIEAGFEGPRQDQTVEPVLPQDMDSRPAGQQYIGFSLDHVLFAVPLKAALEVGQLPGITPLPSLPSWVWGVSNLRGNIVSIVDLKAFLGQGPSAVASNSHMILLHHQEITVGFKVDRLTGIVFFSDRQLASNKSSHAAQGFFPYLSAVVATPKGVWHLVDVKKLMASEKLNAFQTNN